MILRAVLGVARVGDDELDVELGRLEQEGQGPGVVDVAADVGVEDDGNLRREPRAASTATSPLDRAAGA